ncbi:P-loop containing nucleoside triphosphate hydrolase protein [Pelagophyceae sp. CCMP2097]|nr:P-loop containing nucleoside triphosphate hydrolase protein [Pelagophyceae sp. CCMP2097]
MAWHSFLDSSDDEAPQITSAAAIAEMAARAKEAKRVSDAKRTKELNRAPSRPVPSPFLDAREAAAAKAAELKAKYAAALRNIRTMDPAPQQPRRSWDAPATSSSDDEPARAARERPAEAKRPSPAPPRPSDGRDTGASARFGAPQSAPPAQAKPKRKPMFPGLDTSSDDDDAPRRPPPKKRAVVKSAVVVRRVDEDAVASDDGGDDDGFEAPVSAPRKVKRSLQSDARASPARKKAPRDADEAPRRFVDEAPRRAAPPAPVEREERRKFDVSEADDDWMMGDIAVEEPKPKVTAAKPKKAAASASPGDGEAAAGPKRAPRKKAPAAADGEDDGVAAPRPPRRRPPPAVVESDGASDSDDDAEYPAFTDSFFVDDTLTGPLRMDEDGDVLELPKSISMYLCEYQRDGVRWFFKQYASQAGGILADDMGVGKTPQTIAFLAALMRVSGNRGRDTARARRLRKAAERRCRDPTAVSNEEPGFPCSLVLVPASLTTNWENELKKWCICNVASLRSGQTAEERLHILKMAAFGGLDVVIATHSCFIKMASLADGPKEWGVRLKSGLRKRAPIEIERPPAPQVVVIDEVHEFKNPATTKMEAVRPLKDMCHCLFGLTGTPLQNSYNELHTLLSLCTSHRLEAQGEFSNYYKPIERGSARGADREARETAELREKHLKKLISRYVLRRTKEEVLSDVLSTGKDDIVVPCPLKPLQQRLYKTVCGWLDVEVVRRHDEPCPCDRKDDKGKRCKRGACCYPVASVLGGDVSKYFFAGTIHASGGLCKRCPHCWGFSIMAKLQKIANHPALLQLHERDSRDEKKKLECEAFGNFAFGEVDFQRRGTLRSQRFEDMIQVDECGKMEAVANLFEYFRSTQQDPKVLVFSLSTQTLDILEKFVVSKGYKHLRLDGSTPTKRRQEIVNEFNDERAGVFVALISTKAGGVGLNLQSANNVIVFDVNWNPSLDLQAQDRAYRLGQSRRVRVYRLVAQGTLEELTYARQLYKQHLTGAAMSKLEAGKGQKKRRNFVAVQGEVKGELFGMSNLLRYNEGDSILSQLDSAAKKRKMKKGADDGYIMQEDILAGIASLAGGDEDGDGARKVLEALGAKPQRNDDLLYDNDDDDE